MTSIINGSRHRITVAVGQQQALAQRIARLQGDVATGKRIQTPSDDPAGAARIERINRRQADLAVGRDNLRTLAAASGAADSVLDTATVITARARELMVQAATATVSAPDRTAIAVELRALAEQMTGLADTRASNGDPLFSSGAALAVPTVDGVAVTAVASRAAVFGAITTATGPQDAAAIITAAANAIVIADPATRATAIGIAITDLAAADDHLILVRATQGATARRIDDMLDGIASETLVQAEQRSSIEDTDLTTAIARIQGAQLTLQASQGIFARLNQSTLFDLLR